MGNSYQCDMCDQHATVHLTHVANNDIKKVHLCDACAEKKGVSKTDALKLPNLFEENILKPIIDDGTPVLTCEDCGHTPTDFKKIGRLGCPSCYEYLSGFIKPALNGLHQGISHAGKIPKNLKHKNQSRNRLKLIMNDLTQAISEERYEDAALLRDEITKIKDVKKK